MDELMVCSVLVICTGNLCRSPTGERLLRRACPKLKIDSAGTLGVCGHPADAIANNVSEKHGVTLDGHVARQLTSEMVRAYDLLLVMETTHLAQVMELAPWARGKNMLFGLWSEPKTIPDPYHRSYDVFEYVFGLLEQASQQWALRLKI